MIIQGGMGAGVSAWPLARAVSRSGQLGVVAGTALDVILARRLQLGDPAGHMRRALGHFPVPGVAQRILDRYFVPGGKPASAPFRSKPLPCQHPTREADELTVAGNFVEVFLAREGHDNPVGINYLEKIQAPTLPSLYGAMLAGVSSVLMGAGIPIAIPGALDRLADGRPVELTLDVAGSLPGESFTTTFDPARFCGGRAPTLVRPSFLAIVSSASVANLLVRKASGEVDGFIVEGPSAGGHNAPPRGRPTLGADGQPVYGPRDVPDLGAFRELGLPFWVAGSYAGKERILAARSEGAAGVQVGTAFAFCAESGLLDSIKRQVLEKSLAGEAKTHTDPVASPTGFPFKVIPMGGSMSDASVCAGRERVCDLGYLRHAYRREDGGVGWRCPGETESEYARKGGSPRDIVGRKCVCNGLLANIGLEQVRRDGTRERSLLTAGDDVENVARFLPDGADSYSAHDVIDALLR